MADESIRVTIHGDSTSAVRAAKSVETAISKVGAETKETAREQQRAAAAATRANAAQARAARTTGNLHRSTGRLGGSLRSAARFAVGAAAAYVSIAQARTAVTTTLDLAKATTGLNRNLGLTVREASRWGAVAKARDIDSKALTMSFTILSRRFVEASHKGGTAMTAFNRLGISQEETKRGSEDFQFGLTRLAEALGEAEGGAKRQASAQQLLGRGYATVLPLFSEGAKGLKENLKWADEFGATLTGKTNKGLMDLVEQQRRSKVAMLGLQVSFTQAMTPALMEANEAFQELARIMGRDDLTGAEKFERVGQIVDRFAEKMATGIAKSAPLIARGLTRVIPVMVQSIGEQAPKIAGALVKGFLDANVWGKLIVSGWLFSKMGGPAAFMLLGRRGGAAFSTGMATTIATGGAGAGVAGGAAAGGAGGGIIGALRSAGPKIARFARVGLGVTAGVAVVEGAVSAMEDPAKGLTKRLEQIAGEGGLFGDITRTIEGNAPFKQISKVAGTEGDLYKDNTDRANRLLQILRSMPGAGEKYLRSLKRQALAHAGNLDLGAAEFAQLGDFIRAQEKIVRDARRAGAGRDRAIVDFVGPLRRQPAQIGALLAKMMGQFRNMSKPAREAAANTMVGFARMLENKGKLAEGSARAIRRVILRQFDGLHVKPANASAKLARSVAAGIGAAARAVEIGVGAIRDNVNVGLGKFGVKALKFTLNPTNLGTIVGNLTAAAQARGGVVPGRGGHVTKPDLVAWGEEAPRHPEWVIATNPAHRGNNLRYWAQAGSDLGVPGFKKGGNVRDVTMSGSQPWAQMGTRALARLDNAAERYYDRKKPKHAGIAKVGKYKGSGAIAAMIQQAIRIGGKFGMSGSAVDRPGAASYHNFAFSPPHHAVDLSGGNMLAGAKGLIKHFGTSNILELFHDPLGYSIDNYTKGPPGAGGPHFDHVHIAFAKGGKIDVGAFNRTYSNPSKTLPFNTVAAIAESVGLPGVTFAQIAKGESTLRPGVTSGDGGLGLWQITPTSAGMGTSGPDYENMMKLGGAKAMFNPVLNAKQARFMWGSRGLDPWYGKQYVTGSNLHYQGAVAGAGGDKAPTKEELAKQEAGLRRKTRNARLDKLHARLKGAQGAGQRVKALMAIHGFWSRFGRFEQGDLEKIAGFRSQLAYARGTPEPGDDLRVLRALVQFEEDAGKISGKKGSATARRRDKRKEHLKGLWGQLKGTARPQDRLGIMRKIAGFYDRVGIFGKGEKNHIAALKGNIAAAAKTPKLGDDLKAYRALIGYEREHGKISGAFMAPPGGGGAAEPEDEGIGDEGTDTSEEDARLAELLEIEREINRNIVKDLATSQAQYKVFSQFFSGLPFVGAFAQGGPVMQTGLGLLHRGEEVVARGGGGSPVIINLGGDLAPLIRASAPGMARYSDRMIGKRSRRLMFSPGR